MQLAVRKLVLNAVRRPVAQLGKMPVASLNQLGKIPLRSAGRLRTVATNAVRSSTSGGSLVKKGLTSRAATRRRLPFDQWRALTQAAAMPQGAAAAFATLQRRTQRTPKLRYIEESLFTRVKTVLWPFWGGVILVVGGLAGGTFVVLKFFPGWFVGQVLGVEDFQDMGEFTLQMVMFMCQNFEVTAALMKRDPMLMGLQRAARSSDMQNRMLALLFLMTQLQLGDPNIMHMPGLAKLLLDVADNPQQDKNITMHALMMLGFAADDPVVRQDFLKEQGAEFLWRACRAADPEVASVAAIVMGRFIQDVALPDRASRQPKTAEDARWYENRMMSLERIGQINLEVRPSAAAHVFEAMLKTDPGNPNFFALLGIAYERMNQPAKARQLFRKALAQKAALNPGLAPMVFYRAARLKYEERKSPQDVQEAASLLESARGQAQAMRAQGEARELVPGGDVYLPVLQLQIRVLSELGKTQQALARAKDVVDMVPSDSLAQFTYGRLLLKTGKYEDAIQPLYKAFNLNPRLPEPAFKIAMCAYKLRKFDEAAQWAQAAIERLQELEGNPETQADTASKAKVRAETLAGSFRLLGRLHSAQERWPEALQAYDGLLTLPGVKVTPLVHFERGQCLRAQGKHKEAADEFLQALGGWEQGCGPTGSCKAFFASHHADAAALAAIGEAARSLPGDSNLGPRQAQVAALK